MTTPAPPTPAAPVPPAIAGIDAGPVIAMLRGDITRYQRLLQVFADHHAGDVALLQAAAQGGDPPGRRLHAIKGSAATIGAHDLHRLAATLEDRLRQGDPPTALAVPLHELAAALQRLVQQIRQHLHVGDGALPPGA
jgi:HPt (histidine-containing phosphotransfer) domain-containing protein